MNGTIVIMHKSIGHEPPEKNKLLEALDNILKPSKIEDHKRALTESKEFGKQVSKVIREVFYVFRPYLDSIAICFRHTDTYFEVHIESRSADICDTCERAAGELRKVFNRLKTSPKFEITLEEDDGKQTGISADELTFVSLLRGKAKKENFWAVAATAIVFFIVAYCKFKELIPSGIVMGASVGALFIFLVVSSFIEGSTAQCKFRWNFKRQLKGGDIYEILYIPS